MTVSRGWVVLYGLSCALAGVAAFAFVIAFIGDVPLTTRSFDAVGRAGRAETLAVNLSLLALFSLQHSLMARRSFKRWWRRHAPEAIERSSYVLATAAVLGVLYWQWRPMPRVLWSLDGAAGLLMQLVFAGGVVLMTVSILMLEPWDLLGLRQVHLHGQGRPITAPAFRAPGPYRFVRHPLMLGMLLALWGTPVMTAGHLLFAAGTTVYILAAIRWEERDLASAHGELYTAYQARVPGLVPGLRRRTSK